MERIEKTLADLDPAKVDFSSGEWSWGCGGHPLCDDDFFISHVDANLTETRYKLPACINEMLRKQYEHGSKVATQATMHKLQGCMALREAMGLT